jgi:pantothenate kinase
MIFSGKATGGGAYKYADLFKERLGVSLEKEDEMDCLVAGSNFLLKVSMSKLAISYNAIPYCQCCL